MTFDEYTSIKRSFTALKNQVISLCGEEHRKEVEKLLTLTRVLDRAAAEYAAKGISKDSQNVMSFLPDGREIDYQNGDDD
jgi:hypothetical protein